MGLLLAALLLSCACTRSVRQLEFMRDGDCGRAPTNITTLGGIRIVGRCVKEGVGNALHLTVSNDATTNLQAFSLDFCGNVISVDVPKGWVSRVEGNPDLAIDFQIRDEAQPFAIPPGKSLDGFVIRLSPGWRRRAASTARWDSGATGNVMTHDWCK
jgi:hypothetical protein